MGSRTYCGHCYGFGHTVRNCEKLSREIADNPKGYYASRYDHLYNEDGTRKKQERRCSYCRGSNHTIRTCDTKTQDLIYNIKENAKYRRQVYDLFTEKGLAPGALISGYGGEPNAVYLVTGVDYDDKISCGSRSYTHNIHLMKPGHNYPMGYTVDRWFLESLYKSKIEIFSPGINVPPTEEWFSGRSELYENYSGKVDNIFNYFNIDY